MIEVISNNWPLVAIVSAGILILAILIFALANKKYRNRPTDYKALFTMGIIWLGAGVALGISASNWGLFVMGLIFFIIGLSNKNKWKDAPKWSDLSPQQQKFKLGIMLILVVLIIFGLIIFVQID